jgi:hypothetical protein
LLWGIWDHRDLSSGDTAEYFAGASMWAHSLETNPLWSPLYTALWGSLRWIVQDPYASTILHRTLIALAATLLVLAVLRRLLTPGIAWCLAVWWALVPVNYDALYELHVFALLPELAAVLVALTWKGLRMRATVFGLLLVVTVLLRTEIALALVLWTASWIAYEVRERRRGQPTPTSRLVRAVAIPVLAVGVAMAYLAASWPNHNVWSSFEAKQEINLCQSYAFGYQQRHDDFTANPFLQCRELMERKFDQERPTVFQAARANPGALAEHVTWNARLVPYGVQLALFDRISSGENHDPDYVPVKGNSTLALLGSIVVACFLIGGLVLLWRERRRWWESWIRPRAWGWLGLASLAATILPVMVIQRPRPEYLYCLSILILSVVGLCAMAFAERLPGLRRLRVAIPVAALLLVVLLPPHFSSSYQTPLTGRPGRPLKAMVERLYPMRSELRGQRVRLLATYSAPACSYVGEWDPCTPANWSDVFPPSTAGQDPNPVLGAHDVDYIYVDSDDLQDPTIRAVVKGLSPSEWTRVGPPLSQGWTLFRRASTVPPNAKITSSPT